MAAKRVFQISLEIHVESELVIHALASLGKPVVGRTSPVDPVVAMQVRDQLLSGWRVGDAVDAKYLSGPQTASRTTDTDASAAASNVPANFLPLLTDASVPVVFEAVSEDARTIVPDKNARSSAKFGDPTRRPGVAKVLREYLERYVEPETAAAVDQPWPEQELNETKDENGATQARRMRKPATVPATAPAKVTVPPASPLTRREKGRSTGKLEDRIRLPGVAKVLRDHPDSDVEPLGQPAAGPPSAPRKKRRTKAANRAIQAAKMRKPATVPVGDAGRRTCMECGKVVAFGISTGKVVVHSNVMDERCSGSQLSRQSTAKAGQKNTAASDRNVDGNGDGAGNAGVARKKAGVSESSQQGMQSARYYDEYGGQNSVRTVSGGMSGHGKRS